MARLLSTFCSRSLRLKPYRFLSTYTSKDIDEINQEFAMMFGGSSVSAFNPVSGHQSSTISSPEIERSSSEDFVRVEEFKPRITTTSSSSVKVQELKALIHKQVHLFVPGYHDNFVGVLRNDGSLLKLNGFGVDGLGKIQVSSQSHDFDEDGLTVMHCMLENTFLLSSLENIVPSLGDIAVRIGGEFAYQGFVNTIEEGFQDANAGLNQNWLVRNTGLLVTGKDLEDAWEKTVRFEKLAALRLKLIQFNEF
jgi:hypothetical protein